MNTKINTVIEALEANMRAFFNYEAGAAITVDDLRDRTKEALALLHSLPEQGEGPYTIDETIEWLKRRDIFVSAGSRSGFADNLPRVLLDFAAEQAGRLSAQIAHPPQVDHQVQ